MTGGGRLCHCLRTVQKVDIIVRVNGDRWIRKQQDGQVAWTELEATPSWWLQSEQLWAFLQQPRYTFRKCGQVDGPRFGRFGGELWQKGSRVGSWRHWRYKWWSSDWNWQWKAVKIEGAKERTEGGDDVREQLNGRVKCWSWRVGGGLRVLGLSWVLQRCSILRWQGPVEGPWAWVSGVEGEEALGRLSRAHWLPLWLRQALPGDPEMSWCRLWLQGQFCSDPRLTLGVRGTYSGFSFCSWLLDMK